MTSLHIATVESDFNVVKYLCIHFNHFVNSKDSFGFTPLYYAIKLKKPEIVNFLLSVKADPNIEVYIIYN